ncbi:hypothetical protein H8959_014752 [Pygathrix nigripes]
MAYDHYAAICHPLLYGQIMGKQLYKHLVWGSWGLGFLDALINVLLAVNMVFCEAKIIHHYSCEMPSLLPLSCSDISRNLIALLCSTLLHGLGTFLLVFLSYTLIISTILSISSTSGRSEAFTCSAHLTAVILYYGSALLRHLMPNSVLKAFHEKNVSVTTGKEASGTAVIYLSCTKARPDGTDQPSPKAAGSPEPRSQAFRSRLNPEGPAHAPRCTRRPRPCSDPQEPRDRETHMKTQAW